MALQPAPSSDDIRQVLRDLRTPTKLALSPWIASCLVSRRLREEPELTAHEALKKELTTILKQVEADQSEYADLLYGRYWEGLTVKEMVAQNRPRQGAASTFHYIQKDAIEHFAYLLRQKEQACQRMAQLAAGTPPDTPVEQFAALSLKARAVDAADSTTVTARGEAAPEHEHDQRERDSRGQRVRLPIIIAGSGLALIVLIIAFQHLIGAGEDSSLRPTPSPPLAPSSRTIGQMPPATPLASATASAIAFSQSAPITSTVTTTTTQAVSVCGEASRVKAPDKPRFLRDQGVSAFTSANTDGAVLLDRIRALAIDAHGLWIGYFSTDPARPSGLGHYDKQTWANCNQSGGVAGTNINALAIDHSGRLWVGNEKAGIAMYDGRSWHTYTISDGLPSNEIFGLTVDAQNNIWAGTWEGVAKFDGRRWTVPYTTSNNTIFSDHVHAIAFDSAGNIWVGHIHGGVSQYRNVDGKWIWHTPQTSAISGKDIFSIAIRKADALGPESVWFGSDDGVSKYEQGTWTIYREQDGLPGNQVRAVATDPYNRIWAATTKGVAYFTGTRWVTYHALDTLSIAFGPACQGCPFDTDHVWTGTTMEGLTHSRIPLPDRAVDVLEVCFNSASRQRICPALPTSANSSAVSATDAITMTYPGALTPGELVRPEIVIAPRAPYQFREDRGDFLSNTAADNAQLFGAYEHIAVRSTVESGQPYTFTDYDDFIQAPELVAGEREKTFTSTWRMWMHTRYVGPSIHLVFTVRKP